MNSLIPLFSSNILETESILCSPIGGAMNCIPTGMELSNPAGRLIAHVPARLTAIVNMSAVECRGWCRRREDHVAFLKSVHEVVPDERPDLLSSQVVGIIITAAQYVCSEDDSALDFVSEALSAGFEIKTVEV